MRASRKDHEQDANEERWVTVGGALGWQAGGALHEDATSRMFTYTRAEAEIVIAATAALLRLV
ncbi:hypothetical protein ABZ615_11360 [Streptomyces sp. NPDC007325]|uniref:hypothetical protein n=1 Tax=Streptomyces sp. NPDC007325 TaxID=3154588 RepID=UPI0033E1BCED